MDSQSSTSQATAQNDNRNVLGQGANLAQGGSAITQIDARSQIDARAQIDASTSSTVDSSTHINYALDGDVANRAISSASANLGASLDFGAGAMGKSYDLVKRAFEAVSQGENRALDSIANSNSQVQTAYADAKGRGAMTDKITIGAIAMAGLVAFMAVKGK